jgi:hypothetical protein
MVFRRSLFPISNFPIRGFFGRGVNLGARGGGVLKQDVSVTIKITVCIREWDGKGGGGEEGIAGKRGTEEEGVAHWIRDKDKSSSSCILYIE